MVEEELATSTSRAATHGRSGARQRPRRAGPCARSTREESS
ncbi:hypothetical protein QJS66_11830 [Kocuria rhizophila]|nr:hypothetical protein QJS66_11830 [Kocuria rhizophila]